MFVLQENVKAHELMKNQLVCDVCWNEVMSTKQDFALHAIYAEVADIRMILGMMMLMGMGTRIKQGRGF